MEIDHGGKQRSIPSVLIQQAHDTWVATTRNVRISQLHSEVSQLLHAMGISHSVEFLTEGGLFSLDLAIPGKCCTLNSLLLLHEVACVKYLTALTQKFAVTSSFQPTRGAMPASAAIVDIVHSLC